MVSLARSRGAQCHAHALGQTLTAIAIDIPERCNLKMSDLEVRTPENRHSRTQESPDFKSREYQLTLVRFASTKSGSNKKWQ